MSFFAQYFTETPARALAPATPTTPTDVQHSNISVTSAASSSNNAQPAPHEGHADNQHKKVITKMTNKQAASKRKPAAEGPCHFGCATSSSMKNGIMYWKRVPTPSPWETVTSGTVICKKCYDYGMRIRALNEHAKAILVTPLANTNPPPSHHPTPWQTLSPHQPQQLQPHQHPHLQQPLPQQQQNNDPDELVLVDHGSSIKADICPGGEGAYQSFNTSGRQPQEPSGVATRRTGAYQLCETSGRQPQTSTSADEGTRHLSEASARQPSDDATAASITSSQHQGLKRPLPPKSGQDQDLESPQRRRKLDARRQTTSPDPRACRKSESIFQQDDSRTSKHGNGDLAKHAQSSIFHSGEGDPNASACSNDDSKGGHPTL